VRANPVIDALYAVRRDGLTDRPISCARPPGAKSDAARQLPRLTIALAEANCNCRDAVAQM
jgi:hypothetical protein